MIVPFGLLVVVAGGPADVDAAWCTRAHQLMVDAPSTGPTALARFDEASAALLEPGSPVAARARAVVGAEGDFGAAFSVLAAVVDEACAPRSDADAAAVSAQVRELIAQDARFAGVRRGDDVLDRLRHKLFLWLSQLFESEGMQRFAGSTRTIFFAALAAAALALAVRVARRLRRRSAASASSPSPVEAARAEAFATLRSQAAACLAQGDARGALLAGARALLVRVGERDPRAVRAARTHREILAGLARPVATAVAPALGAFERALFANAGTVDDATRFLALVDDAAARITALAASDTRTS